jgi:hypothetical protein
VQKDILWNVRKTVSESLEMPRPKERLINAFGCAEMAA